ncbi:ASCH domain-containing protein [Yersinia massiliensis]|uniref:ASCH domain-containing protein n=1 Tax=Yersinia massiliensis TaxID=419257 RepID=UPI001CFF44C0|nr:ASCH domain-containing protein [Yersinia massiliensis]MCB5308315.1 ASCH domain-containing protein [Yersinia massiliensis]
MKALSIRQPWAWLIVNGYKDIENRNWRTKYRGPVLIHASAVKPSKADMEVAREIMQHYAVSHRLPERHNFPLGGIVGISTITGCVDESPSPWFFGFNGFTLADAKVLPFRPFKGRLSFFETGMRPHKVFNVLVPEGYKDATEME